MNRIALGFGVIIAMGLGAYALTGQPAIGLIAGAVTMILLPRSLDPAIQIKEHQLRHIQPEMRPGPKTWKVGNKADDSGETLEQLRTNSDGQPLCPNCGEPSLLQGPSGGMSMNSACESCLHAFNLGMFDSPPLVMERQGLMSKGRAAIFGITAEEYDANPNSLPEEV